MENFFGIETKKFVLEYMLAKVNIVNPFQIDMKAERGVLSVYGCNPSGKSVLAVTSMVMTTNEGVLTLPTDKLIDIITTSDEGDFTIKANPSGVSLASGTTKWQIKLRDKSVYQVPDIGEMSLHTIDRETFVRAINAVSYAAGTSIYNTQLYIEDRKISALDMQRFHQVSLGEQFPDISFNIDIYSVSEISEFLRKGPNEIQIGTDSKFVVIRAKAIFLILNNKLTDRIDLDKYLLRPALSNKDECLVDRQELIDAVKRIRIVSQDKVNSVILRINGNTLSVESANRVGDRAKEILEIKWGKKDKLLVLNHNHLLDMLEHYDGKVCYFYLADDTKSNKSPILLRDANQECLVMLAQLSAGSNV